MDLRSYTTIEQSRKLAEILPLDSADLKWFFWMEESAASKKPSFGYSKTAAESYKDTEAIYLPCWSLAALLGVIPYPTLHRTISGWRCDMCNKKGYISQFGEVSDNPIDTCYNMIIKLHELNLL